MDKSFQEISPEAVLLSRSLDPEEKSKILHEWEQDEIALLRATDENMSGAGRGGEAGDLLMRIRKAESALAGDSKNESINEMVAVFRSEEDLQKAIDDLELNGFSPLDISVLAGKEAVQEKLGHVYRRIEEAADDPDAPRTMLVPGEVRSEAIGTAIGVPFYVAALLATGITAASGGTLLETVLAAAAAGAVGAAIGGIMAGMISRRHARYIQQQIDLGGLLLWVRLRKPDRKGVAKNILKRHNAFGVRAHKIAI